MQDVSEAAQISIKFCQEKMNFVMMKIINSLKLEWKCVSVSVCTQHGECHSSCLVFSFSAYIYSVTCFVVSL